jgi:hypothetical protein
MERVNLADPDFEPTDEQLMALSRAAFADVPEERRKADERLRREIARLRVEALELARRPLPETP